MRKVRKLGNIGRGILRYAPALAQACAISEAFKPVAHQKKYLMDYTRKYVPQVTFLNSKHIHPASSKFSFLNSINNASF